VADYACSKKAICQCVAMCCSVLQQLQRVAVSCSELQHGAVCYSVKKERKVWRVTHLREVLHVSVLQWVAVCCSVLQCVAVCYSVLKCE